MVRQQTVDAMVSMARNDKKMHMRLLAVTRHEYMTENGRQICTYLLILRKAGIWVHKKSKLRISDL